MLLLLIEGVQQQSSLTAARAHLAYRWWCGSSCPYAVDKRSIFERCTTSQHQPAVLLNAQRWTC